MGYGDILRKRTAQSFVFLSQFVCPGNGYPLALWGHLTILLIGNMAEARLPETDQAGAHFTVVGRCLALADRVHFCTSSSWGLPGRPKTTGTTKGYSVAYCKIIVKDKSGRNRAKKIFTNQVDL